MVPLGIVIGSSVAAVGAVVGVIGAVARSFNDANPDIAAAARAAGAAAAQARPLCGDDNGGGPLKRSSCVVCLRVYRYGAYFRFPCGHKCHNKCTVHLPIVISDNGSPKDFLCPKCR